MNAAIENQKKQIIVELKTAYENTLIEQDESRSRIEAMESVKGYGYFETLKKLKWKGLSDAMAGESYPPTWEDRKEHLNQERKEFPMQIKISTIEDKDIRFHTHFLNEVVEHSHRIRSMANFCEILGASPKDSKVCFLFSLWVDHNICTQLSNEQLEVGHAERGETLKQVAMASAEVFDIFSQDPSMLKGFDKIKEQKNQG